MIERCWACNAPAGLDDNADVRCTTCRRYPKECPCDEQEVIK